MSTIEVEGQPSTSDITATADFKKQVAAIAKAICATPSDQNTARTALFNLAKGMDSQVAYRGRLIESNVKRLKGFQRAATQLENGLEGSDLQERKESLFEQREQVEANLERLQWELFEEQTMLDIFKAEHDMLVAESGKGEFFDDVMAKYKGMAERSKAAANTAPKVEEAKDPITEKKIADIEALLASLKKAS
jgi:NADH:ubiquinone oxidoreductase subunit D